jgi:hypothetical protein
MSQSPPLKEKDPIRSAGQGRIINACEKHWNAHKNNCSGFVNAVADQLGVPLPRMQANQIIDLISTWKTISWWKVGLPMEAAAYAENGYFVLACLKDSPYGHVAIVTSGYKPDNGRYPRGYWGTLNSVGEKNGTMNYSFRKTDEHKVAYFRYMHKL